MGDVLWSQDIGGLDVTDQPNRIAVIRFNDEYRIVAATGAWGRFRFRVDAEEAAIRVASRRSEGGAPCELLVQDSFGELLPLRT